MPDAPILTHAELRRRWQEVSGRMLAELPRERRRGALPYVKWLLRVTLVAPLILPMVVMQSFLDWVTDGDARQEWRKWGDLFRLHPLRDVPYTRKRPRA